MVKILQVIIKDFTFKALLPAKHCFIQTFLKQKRLEKPKPARVDMNVATVDILAALC